MADQTKSALTCVAEFRERETPNEPSAPLGGDGSPLPSERFSATVRMTLQRAPHRSDELADDCIFCKIVNKELPADIVFEDDELIAFNDISPQAPIHVLVVPKVHIPTVNDLDEDDAGLVGRMVLRAQALAQARGIDGDGYRLILNCNEGGGQTVFHIHLHLLGGRQMRAFG